MAEPVPIVAVCERAEQLLADSLDRRRWDLLRLLSRCESPIEQIMAVAMWDAWHCQVAADGFGMTTTLQTGRFGGGEYLLRIEPQKIIHGALRRYRADFYLSASHCLDEMPICRNPLVVEVDGHDWHERTKWQAAYDKRRDRELLTEGFVTLRFTGGEVVGEPERCLREVLDLVMASIARDRVRHPTS